MGGTAARLLALVAVVGSSMRPAVAAEQTTDVAALLAQAQRDASAQVRRSDLAIPLFVRALDLSESSRDWRGAAQIAVQLGAAYRSTHQADAALRVLEHAIGLARAAHDPAVETDALRMMGNVHSEDGQNELAVGLYERGLGIAERLGDDDRQVAILNALSVTARHQGKLPEALDLARRALALLDGELARGHAVDAAPLFAVPFNVGKALSDAGDYGSALPYFERAFAAAEQHQMIAGIWHALFDTAEWYQGQGDLDRADDYYHRALVQSRKTESHDMEANTIRGLAMIAEARGDLQEAVNGYRTALDMYERYGFGAWVPSTMAALARAEFNGGDDRGAAALLERGLALAKNPDKPLDRTRLLLELGRERYARRQLRGAAAAFDEGRNLAVANGLRPMEAIALGSLADVARDSGDAAHALDLYAAAERVLDTLQETIPAQDQRATFKDATGAIYEGHVSLLLALHDRHPDTGYARRALAVLERERQDDLAAPRAALFQSVGGARTTAMRRISALQMALMADDLPAASRPALLASLADAERNLEATAHDVPTGQPSPAASESLADGDPDRAMARFQTLMSADEAVLVYAPAHALVITRDRLIVVPLSAPRDLESRIDFFVRMLAGPDAERATLAGHAIASALVAPVLKALPGRVTHLVFCSGGPYPRVPYAALPDPSGPVDTPLLQRFAISHVPSLAVLQSLRRAPPPVAMGGLLAIADPERSDPSGHFIPASLVRGGTLAPLPYAVEEVTRAASNAVRARTLVGADASEAALKRLDLSQYEILHFATHALLDPVSPMRSGIVLSPGGGEDGLLQPREILQLRLRAALVVLAGCRTAAGRRSSVEGMQSLARAFLMAGSRSVLGTLWDVDDRATSILIDRFYQYASAGEPLDQALRHAQLSFGSDNPYAAASTWAAFQLIGAGDERPAVLRRPRDDRAALVLAISAGILLMGGLIVRWRRPAIANRLQ